MKTIIKIFSAITIFLSALMFVSCDSYNEYKPEEPKIEIQDIVEIEAIGGIKEIPLVSNYPWISSSNAEWIKFIKERGQMTLQEKIIIDVQPNTTNEVRESGLQIRLMDRATIDIIIRQKAK